MLYSLLAVSLLPLAVRSQVVSPNPSGVTIPPCETCPNNNQFGNWVLGLNSKCYLNRGQFTYTDAQDKCLNVPDANPNIVTDFYELQIASPLLGPKGVWVSGQAQGPGRFDPPVWSRPGSKQEIKATATAQCLAFTYKKVGATKRQSRPSRFKAAVCTARCYAFCCADSIEPTPRIFGQAGTQYKLRAYLGGIKLNYADTKKFCEDRGGFLPWVKTRGAWEAAVAAHCGRDDFEFWTNAHLTWENGAQAKPLEWVNENGGIETKGAFNTQLHPVPTRNVKFFVRKCSKVDHFDVVYNEKGRAKLQPVCMFAV